MYKVGSWIFRKRGPAVIVFEGLNWQDIAEKSKLIIFI